MQTYPIYYHHRATCIRVDSPQETCTITLQPDTPVATRHPTYWPTPERLAERLATMHPSTEKKFKEYLATFRAQVREESNLHSHQRQQLFDAGKLKL